MATSPSSRHQHHPPEEVHSMELGRCLQLVPATGLVLAGALALGGQPLLAAAPAAWEPEACGSGGAPPGQDDTWYRLDPVLDRTGTLEGTRRSMGSGTGPGRSVALPAEAFASGPVEGRVITGADDGSESLVRAVDPARGCATLIARERAAVVRSAVAAADGLTLYEHRVDRRTRADLGIWRRDLVAWQTSGTARQVVDPLPAAAAEGPIFTTGLLLDGEGGLVISSCGERACVLRALDRDGVARRIDGAGPALGASGGTIVARAACSGLPCPVVAHDPDGTTRVLEDEAWHAAMGGRTVVVEGAEGALRAIDARSGATAPVDGGGRIPVDGGSLATSGFAAAPDEIVLAPDGRVSGSDGARRILPRVKAVTP
jgi:hypothetical protein